MKPTTNFEIEKVKPLLVKWMRIAADTKEKAIPSTVMIAWINDKYKGVYSITGQRFRFLINEMRRNSEWAICANCKGYWITNDITENYKSGISLVMRGSSIIMAGLGQINCMGDNPKWVEYQKKVEMDMADMVKKYEGFFTYLGSI